MARPKKGRIRTVGIVVRPDDDAASSRARRLAKWLAGRKVSVLAHPAWVPAKSDLTVHSRKEMMAAADLVVVLGGDGSLLGVARLSGRGSAPVIGINLGELGFLTESDQGNLHRALGEVLEGRYELQQRTMLSITVLRGKRRVVKSQALNDAVVTRGTFSRPLRLSAMVDGEELAGYIGDGLIIATPTGSTAYSLSAGGPVVEPTMSAILVTPIAAHTLTSRPVVLPDRSVVAVQIEDDCDDAVLTLDGQEWFELAGGDVVEVRKSSNRAAIVTTKGHAFFRVLHEKLHWGARGR
jgi:NAD+ kinase